MKYLFAVLGCLLIFLGLALALSNPTPETRIIITGFLMAAIGTILCAVAGTMEGRKE